MGVTDPVNFILLLRDCSPHLCVGSLLRQDNAAVYSEV